MFLLRFSDFKSNEYANLIGGKLYEPEEENPMMGWRGASRYYDPKFEEAFALEWQAVKKVREEMGLWNLSVMIPFCRTPEEGKKVVEEIKKNGLTNRITPRTAQEKEKWRFGGRYGNLGHGGNSFQHFAGRRVCGNF